MHYFMPYESNYQNIVRFLNEFKCQRCDKPCCIRIEPGEGIALLPYESKQLAKALGISHHKFKETYTFTREGRRFLFSPCPFYDEKTKTCIPEIRKDRPQVCKQFPFSRFIQVNGKRMMTVNVDCPGGRIIGEKYGVKPESVGVEV